jgi:hypothetical protein
MLAKVIERYVDCHPKAADTAEGIRGWWMREREQNDSVEDVETALDYLIARGCLSRIVLPDGTVIYARADRAEN